MISPRFSFSLPSRPIIPFTPNENAQGAEKDEEAKWYNNITYSYGASGVQRIHATHGLDTAHKEIAQNLSLSLPIKFMKWITIKSQFFRARLPV